MEPDEPGILWNCDGTIEYLQIDAPEFRVGDVVRLTSGKVPQEVVKVDSVRKRLVARYFSDKGYTDWSGRPYEKWRPFSNYVKIESEPEAEKEKTVSNLYQTKDGKFGTYLATNSAGLIVLEMKGSGAAEAYDKKDLEIVRPYTVALKSAQGIQHYRAKKGSLAVGDIIINGFTIYVVTELDTKSETSARVKGRLLEAKELPELDGEDA